MGKFHEGLSKQLSLYVKQQAWLETIPEKEKATRQQRLQAQGLEPDFPPLDAGHHLLGYLWDVGPVTGGDMGAAPLSWQEMASWQAQTGIELQPWEARLLRRLSGDYLEAHHAARAPDCPAPYLSEETMRRNRETVGRQIRNAMKTYFAAKTKG